MRRWGILANHPSKIFALRKSHAKLLSSIHMKVKTKRFDKSLPFPEYEPGAAGFDFICRKGTIINPGETKAIPSNLAMKVPEGYVLLVTPRSSTSSKYGLIMPHSIGIIDPFYCDDSNEIMLIFHNFTQEKTKVETGDKIAQGILIKSEKLEFDEVANLGNSRVKGAWKKPASNSNRT